MKRVFALLLSLVLALGLFSCVNAEQDKPFVGILAPSTTHGWVGGVAYFAQQAIVCFDAIAEITNGNVKDA